MSTLCGVEMVSSGAEPRRNKRWIALFYHLVHYLSFSNNTFNVFFLWVRTIFNEELPWINYSLCFKFTAPAQNNVVSVVFLWLLYNICFLISRFQLSAGSCLLLRSCDHFHFFNKIPHFINNSLVLQFSNPCCGLLLIILSQIMKSNIISPLQFATCALRSLYFTHTIFYVHGR